MSQLNDFRDGEFEVAIAAAAYAITSMEEGSKRQKSSAKGSESSLAKLKSKSDDSTIRPISVSGSFKRLFTIKDAKENDKTAVSGDISTRISTTENQIILDNSPTNQNTREKAMGGTPSVMKRPTITDNYLNDTGSKRVESGNEIRPRSKAPSTKNSTTFSLGDGSQDWTHDISESEIKADAWEKAQMIKIKQRYDNTISMIMEWENEKKAKAKRNMERRKNGPEERRTRAIQKYNNDISRIDKVAGDARALADDRKRNYEAKAREKAKQIRLTGEIPRACYCF